MSEFDNFMLAQANAAMDDVTVGQMLSALMVLLVIAASLAMIVVWVVRLGQSGHALPAAERGLLRVPLPLTIVVIGLSLLMLVMMTLVSTEDQIIPPPVAAAPVASAEVEVEVENAGPADNSASSEAPPKESDEAAAAPPADRKLTPKEMKSKLLSVVVMDLMLFLVFGVVVFLSNGAGRVRLPDDTTGVSVPVSKDLGSSLSQPSNSSWPDLEDASAIPQLPGYSVLGERTTTSTSPEPGQSGDSFYAPSRDASFNQLVGAESEWNGEPDEPFSFLTELRFAGEVFLAAYVPTTFLRVLVVLLTVGLLGEEPGQHPFLEMMNSGVGTTVMALILLTAVFFAPMVEELQFRVIALGGLAQKGHPMLALTVSSILFAFAHGFPDSLALLPLAFALGYAYLRRRSYITVMLVHLLFNGFNMAIALLALL